MSEGTKIEWCQATINPLGWGCYGPGGTAEKPKRCEWCYAHRFAKRNLRKCPECRAFVPHWHDEEWLKPFGWRKSRRVFVQSMGDLFGAGVDPRTADYLLMLCDAVPHHNYLALTKEPALMAERMAGRMAVRRPPRNLWLGTSISNQTDADERVPHLLRTPAAVRWLSIEPLLGPILLRRHMRPSPEWARDIDWVVIGAQTGPGAVAPKWEWITSIIEQCDAAGVPVFLKDNLGWPTPVREFPEVRA